jgi:hydrogenase-4 membrane subunit HyfE
MVRGDSITHDILLRSTLNKHSLVIRKIVSRKNIFHHVIWIADIGQYTTYKLIRQLISVLIIVGISLDHLQASLIVSISIVRAFARMEELVYIALGFLEPLFPY